MTRMTAPRRDELYRKLAERAQKKDRHFTRVERGIKILCISALLAVGVVLASALL
jgi:hypothetical protein